MALAMVEPPLKYRPFVLWYLTAIPEPGSGTLCGG